MFASSVGSDAAGRGMGQAFGLLLALVAAAAAGAMLLGRRRRGWLFVAGVIVGLPFVVVGLWTLAMARQEAKTRGEMADMHSGKADFANQPALLAVAQAIAKNDPDAIRSAATTVPDLQASGENGKTLLYFAVDQALGKRELIEAVQTLLSLGADPNYNNGQLDSFALWRAVSGSVDLLRTMLDTGGNPNGPDFRGNPIILFNWELTFNRTDALARLRLLLDRGADINTAYPEKSPMFPGYSLLLARANMGRSDHTAYTDAIELLERGADGKRVALDGASLAGLIDEHRKYYAEAYDAPPPEFQALWDWMGAHTLRPQQD